MIALAARTAAARAGTLAGPFIALALGTALLTAVTLNIIASAGAMGAAGQPRWFSRATVVVAGADKVSVTSGTGDDRETESTGTVLARAIPAGAGARLAALGARLGVPVVTDYAGYARAPGAPGGTMHPWAAASLHGYAWVAGGPPQPAGHGTVGGAGALTGGVSGPSGAARGLPGLVLTAPTEHRPGDRVIVQTAAGPQRFAVTGVIRTSASPALYAAGPVAARLAGDRITAVALLPGRRSAGHGRTAAAALAAQARTAVRGWPVRVLTGAQRGTAAPSPNADLATVAISVLGTASGLAAFMAIFVVAGTFAQSVAARRRELALLRATGATPRQLRRLVLGEAALIGVLAAVPGGVLGIAVAGSLASWMAGAGLAPAGLSAHLTTWPAAAAGGACVLIGLLGALAPARRAGRIRPAEALREAGADRRVMGWARWVAGLLALAGVPPVLAAFAAVHSADGTALMLPAAILMILGVIMLAPALVRPLTWLLTPLTGGGAAAGLLARHSSVAAARRTAAALAPVVLTAGFAGAMLAGSDTVYRTQSASAASRVTAPFIVTPAGGSGGLSTAALTALGSAPGVAAAVPVESTTVYARSGGDPEDWTAQYAGPGIGRMLRLPVVAGRLADLTGTGTVAVPAGTWRLGQTAMLWLADSAPVRLRVVAVYADDIDLDQTVLLPWALRAGHTAAPLASAVYVRLRPGAGPAGLRAAAAHAGGVVSGTRDFLAAATTQNQRLNQAALLAVLGLALLYSSVAIGNTAAMGIGSRRAEFGALRLSGATRRQVLAMVGLETWLATVIGLILAGCATAVTLTGVRIGLASIAPVPALVVPWRLIALIAVGALVIAELASLVPAAWTVRRRPAGLAAAE
jgi:putative ABC transport system permease protein